MNYDAFRPKGNAKMAHEDNESATVPIQKCFVSIFFSIKFEIYGRCRYTHEESHVLSISYVLLSSPL